MPLIRNEHFATRASRTAGSKIDITDYDIGLRYDTDAMMVPCGAGEVPVAIACDSAEIDETVSFIYLSKGMQVGLRLYGTGSAGKKIACDSSGRFVASATNENATINTSGVGDIGVAKEDWDNSTLNDYVECDILI